MDLRNSRAAMILRRLKWLLWASPMPSRGHGCKVHCMARFGGHPDKMRLGDGAIVEAYAYVYCHRDGEVSVGNRSFIGENAIVHTGRRGGRIRIGDDSSLQSFSIIYGHGGVDIGNGVRIAAHTVIIPANHRFSDPGVPIHQQGLSCEGIRVEDNVWIGAGVVILDGVVVGAGSVVAAGSVVNSNVAPGEIVGGIPARPIGRRVSPAGSSTSMFKAGA